MMVSSDIRLVTYLVSPRSFRKAWARRASGSRRRPTPRGLAKRFLDRAGLFHFRGARDLHGRWPPRTDRGEKPHGPILAHAWLFNGQVKTGRNHQQGQPDE